MTQIVECDTQTLSMLDVSQERIASFCARWRIREFALFGSVLREDFRPGSDIDVLVTFAPDAHWSLLDEASMEIELEALFGRSVDLVNKAGIEQSQNWLRREEILTTAVPTYVQT